MFKVNDLVKLNNGGMCSQHKGQEGVIIRITGEGSRASYFIKFDDEKTEIHRSQHFKLIRG